MGEGEGLRADDHLGLEQGFVDGLVVVQHVTFAAWEVQGPVDAVVG